MPREYKYYGTTTSVYLPDGFRRKHGNYHNQYRVVAKAKSFAEANRIATEITGHNLFVRGFTAITGNAIEIELCDRYGIIISTDRIQNQFISLQEAINMIE